MFILFILLLLIVIFIWFSKKESRWIKYGKLKGSKYRKVNRHKYYLEEVEFAEYQEALHTFYKVVNDVAAYDEVLEVKYDLYNWMFTIFRFKNTTIELRNLRSFNRIQLIKSTAPISLEEYEMDSTKF